MGLIRVQNSVEIHRYKAKVHGKKLRVSPRISIIASCEHTLRDFFCSGFCRVPGRRLVSFNGANPHPIHQCRFRAEAALISDHNFANSAWILCRFQHGKACRVQYGICVLSALKSAVETGAYGCVHMGQIFCGSFLQQIHNLQRNPHQT